MEIKRLRFKVNSIYSYTPSFCLFNQFFLVCREPSSCASAKLMNSLRAQMTLGSTSLRLYRVSMQCLKKGGMFIMIWPVNKRLEATKNKSE